jgi:hypothetical protein
LFVSNTKAVQWSTYYFFIFQVNNKTMLTAAIRSSFQYCTAQYKTRSTGGTSLRSLLGMTAAYLLQLHSSKLVTIPSYVTEKIGELAVPLYLLTLAPYLLA